MIRKKNTLSYPVIIICCMIIVGGIASQAHYTTTHTAWGNMQVSKTELRGDDGTVLPSVYSEADLASFYASFQEKTTASLEANAAKKWYFFRTPPTYAVAVEFSELKQGVLSMSVNASNESSGEQVKSWTRTFDNPEGFAADFEAFSTQVGSDLSAL